MMTLIRYCVLAVVPFLILSLPCQAVLVGHWTGNGSPNDSSGFGHHGTLVGDTIYGTGVVGDAFSFDGIDDYVTIPNATPLESSVITVTAFAKMPDTGSSQRLIVDSSHGFIDQKGWALQTDPGGSVSFIYGNGGAFIAAGSTTLIDDDQFHHLAGVLDGSMISIYVDGVLETSVAFTGTAQASGRQLRIGSAWGGDINASIREVDGQIDDVQIYDEALSGSQIASLASAVPEPSSAWALMLGAVVIWKRRLKKKTA